MKVNILVLLIILTACKTSDLKSSNEMFTSGKYLVLTLNEKDFSEKDDYQINIDTSQNSLNGKFDCNTFNVNYEIKEDNTIEFGYAISTKMYCEGKMALENNFFKSLKSLKFFKFENDFLSFYNENEDLILKLKKLKS